MSAAEKIKPIILRLRAQSFAVELTASAFSQIFTKLGKKYQRLIVVGDCCLAITEEKFIAIIYST